MTDAQLEAESTHVGRGSFRIDEKRRAAKMKKNVEKIWRHRAWVVFDAFVLDYRGPWSAFAVLLSIVVTAVVWGETGLRWLAATCITIIILLFLTCEWIFPAWDKIRGGWNP